ncbi:MAG: hypothetical protein V1656_01470 [Candidatus Jorgensenbacteria bacterium]
MNKIIQTSIIAALIILVLAGIIFGAYAPLVKSTRYIKALGTVSSIHTMGDFEQNFLPALTHWSPIGQEEVVKFLANDIMSIASQPEQPEVVARMVVDFIEPYLFKDNVRHMLIGGGLRAILWLNYGRQETDFEKAEAYYRAALAIGPKLPPPLYALLDLYRQKGDGEKENAIKDRIVALWPDAFSER